MKTLPCLNNNMIKELIPVIGHRARFISNLEQWKSIIIQGIPNVNPINYAYLFKVECVLCIYI